MTLFQETGDAQVHTAIKATVQQYIDGYLGQDAVSLRKAFTEDAKLMTVDQGVLSGGPVSTWFDRIEAKKKSDGGTLTADWKILGVDCSQDAAVAKVQLDFAEYVFVDYLSLLKTGNGWIITNKIYDVQEH